MKKIFLLIVFVLIMSLLFSACSDKLDKVKSELIGGQFSGGNGIYVKTYNFRADGTYYSTLTNSFGTQTEHGTYEVTKDAIVLCDQNGGYVHLTYTYNSDNGNLILYHNNNALTKSG